MAIEWKEGTVNTAGTNVRIMEAGSGVPTLILHHDIGTLDRLPFYDAMAAQGHVIIPTHPGWGINSERPEWLRSVRDIAAMYRMYLAGRGIEKANLVGLGFGGWIAAEMATMSGHDIGKVALVSAMGVQPTEGFILDMAIVGYLDYARAFFANPSRFTDVYGEPTGDMLEGFDLCREMCFRTAWKPYMYSLTLPHLLKSMTAETLVVWGEKDSVVPMSSCDRYMESLPNARKEIVAGSGHAVDMDKPDQLASLVSSFFNT
jgi:pimeloyl-ACP methyl ester carboxylesterase